MAHLKFDKHRVLICLLSVGMASGLFLLLGLQRHAVRLLGHWYFGVATLFAILFVGLSLACLRGRFSKVRWVFPVCLAISYVAAIGAQLAYFSIWESTRTTNALKHFGIADFVATQFLGPTIALVWVLGVFTGVLFLLLQRATRIAPD
jgi:hypothetical protein